VSCRWCKVGCGSLTALITCDVIEKKANPASTATRIYATLLRLSVIFAIAEQSRLRVLQVDTACHEGAAGRCTRVLPHAREWIRIDRLCTTGWVGCGSGVRKQRGTGAGHGAPVMLIQPNDQGMACPFGPECILVLIENAVATSPALSLSEEAGKAWPALAWFACSGSP